MVTLYFKELKEQLLPANSSFLKDSNTYTSEELVTNTLVDIPYTSLTELNGVITVTLDQDYKLATNMMMEEIAGGYLATDKAITVLSSNSFSFLKNYWSRNNCSNWNSYFYFSFSKS